MVFIPVNNGAVVSLRGELFGAEVVNTLSFLYPTAFNSEVLTDLCDFVEGWWSTNVAPLICNQYVLRELYALSLESITAPAITYPATGGGVAGGNNAPGLPGTVALAVSFRTAARGRSGRGRNFVSGLAESDVVGNEVSEFFAQGIRAAYAQLITLTEPTDWTWCVFQKYSNKQPLPLGVPRPIRSVVVTDRTVDSQRRRKD